MFAQDSKFRDGGLRFLRKVRSSGIDPSIRADVWPFLLGVYNFNSSKEERETLRTKNRKEYEKLRKQCSQFLTPKETGRVFFSHEDSSCFDQDFSSPDSEDVVSARESFSSEETITYFHSNNHFRKSHEANESHSPPTKIVAHSEPSTTEDFASWQRIIRLDAVRVNEEWTEYSPVQANMSNEKARQAAVAVGLKDQDQLEPSRMFHAARLTAILEAYALYDPEIGYCQGMCDLLSPIIAVITEDHEAFWCFVGFMKKARHNFRLDELGIRRQLVFVSRIIRRRDPHLYRHLEKLEAEDCFFVYRMVVVLFRRELSFEQTICLWEVMWADQAAIRAGIGESAWNRIRQRAPPTKDLLLYAVAASVLQRRKQIIENSNCIDDIVRECNNMAGHLDVWKLLDDAHNLVVTDSP